MLSQKSYAKHFATKGEAYCCRISDAVVRRQHLKLDGAAFKVWTVVRLLAHGVMRSLVATKSLDSIMASTHCIWLCQTLAVCYTNGQARVGKDGCSWAVQLEMHDCGVLQTSTRIRDVDDATGLHAPLCHTGLIGHMFEWEELLRIVCASYITLFIATRVAQPKQIIWVDGRDAS